MQAISSACCCLVLLLNNIWAVLRMARPIHCSPSRDWDAQHHRCWIQQTRYHELSVRRPCIKDRTSTKQVRPDQCPVQLLAGRQYVSQLQTICMDVFVNSTVR